MYGEDTLDSMIYPWLRLKSAVISSVVDGNIDNTFQIQNSTSVPIQWVLDQIKIPQGYKSKYKSDDDELVLEEALSALDETKH